MKPNFHYRVLQYVLLSLAFENKKTYILIFPIKAGILYFCDPKQCVSYLLLFSSQNDHDPSKLVAETPCKLLRFLVPDGSHVDTDAPYAEVEVMKMCMPLLLPASGVIHFIISEGQAMQVNILVEAIENHVSGTLIFHFWCYSVCYFLQVDLYI